MGTEPLERKLAAIFYADVAGYSRLTGEDEEGTHRILRSYLDHISSSIQNHNGRVVHYAGDAVLADFGTVVDALTCAAAIQSDLDVRNSKLSDERKLQFRIGINLGDVIVDQTELYGDGVNVAARLENLADPGGICISEAVRAAVGKKLALKYEYMGEQEVKNIAEPVRTYKVLVEADELRPSSASALVTGNTEFMISDWLVEPSVCHISQGGKSVKLEPKAMNLLVYLAQRPGDVLSRKELEDNIWRGTVVSYDALTNAIIKLRKAFGDDPKHHYIIETIPKKGYRLVAEVRKTNEPNQAARISGEPRVSPATSWKSPGAVVLMLSALLLSVVVYVLWQYLRPPTQEGTAFSSDSVVAPISGKPSIAVLPFANLSGDKDQEYFSDGITEDIITDLSKISGLFVIARNSTFQYKGRSTDIKQVADELGVRYILEGSVRRDRERVRINAQLVDATTGGHLWADRYDGSLKDVFALQDKVTEKIIAALAVQLTTDDQARYARLDTENPAAYDEFLQGWERYWKFSRKDFAKAEKHFKKALLLDPDYSRANAALALIYWQTWKQKWHENLGWTFAGWERADHYLKEAMTNPTPLTHRIKSEMLVTNRRYDEAIAEAERAIALNPNNATGYLALADVLGFSGRPLKAIENARKGMRLDPNFPSPYLAVTGRAQFDLERLDEAVVSLKRAASGNPNDRSPLITLTAAYGHLGWQQDAARVLDELNRLHTKERMRSFTIDWQKNRWPYRYPRDRERLIEGLRKAGVPEW